MRKIRNSAAVLLALSIAAPVFAKDNPDVTGVVRDDTKSVVTNATVRLLHRDDAGKLAEVETVETNAKGRFEFKDVHPGTFVIVAMSGKKQLRDRTTITVTDKDISNIEFSLRRGEEEADEKAATKADKADLNVAAVHGNARFAAKDFVKNAKVRLLSGHGTDFSSMREIDTTTTDSKGDFTFPKVQQGDYTIVVTLGKSEGSHKITINPKEKTEDVDILVK